MGVLKGDSQNPRLSCATSSKTSSQIWRLWDPYFSCFFPAQGQGWSQSLGCTSPAGSQQAFPVPRTWEQRARASVGKSLLHRSHDIFAVCSLPIDSPSTHISPIFPHQAKICFPKSLKPPRTQHKTGHDSRGGPGLHSVFLPNNHREESLAVPGW